MPSQASPTPILIVQDGIPVSVGGVPIPPAPTTALAQATAAWVRSVDPRSLPRILPPVHVQVDLLPDPWEEDDGLLYANAAIPTPNHSNGVLQCAWEWHPQARRWL